MLTGRERRRRRAIGKNGGKRRQNGWQSGKESCRQMREKEGEGTAAGEGIFAVGARGRETK